AEESVPVPGSLRCFQAETCRPKFQMTKNSARASYLLIAFVVVVLDRWSKHVVAQRIPLYRNIQIIPGFFRLTHTENTGAAFSLFGLDRALENEPDDCVFGDRAGG